MEAKQWMATTHPWYSSSRCLIIFRMKSTYMYWTLFWVTGTLILTGSLWRLAEGPSTPSFPNWKVERAFSCSKLLKWKLYRQPLIRSVFNQEIMNHKSCKLNLKSEGCESEWYLISRTPKLIGRENQLFRLPADAENLKWGVRDNEDWDDIRKGKADHLFGGMNCTQISFCLYAIEDTS